MAGTNPRAARIAALIQRVIASSMEAQLHDKRLANVTITEVRVTNDLQIAKVYWTQLGHEGHEQGERRRAQQALNQAKGRLRSLVGTKAGLRLTPQLEFIFDEVPGEAHEIEDILALAHKRDEELAKSRAKRAIRRRRRSRTSTTSPMMTTSTMMTMSRSRIGTMTTKPDNSGLLVIDKPQGVTSFDVVAAARGALHIKKVGHAGHVGSHGHGIAGARVRPRHATAERHRRTRQDV